MNEAAKEVGAAPEAGAPAWYHDHEGRTFKAVIVKPLAHGCADLRYRRRLRRKTAYGAANRRLQIATSKRLEAEGLIRPLIAPGPPRHCWEPRP